MQMVFWFDFCFTAFDTLHADGIANSVDPDQTAPLGAVWSGSALFVQAYLSENLGSLWYIFSYPSSK